MFRFLVDAGVVPADGRGDRVFFRDAADVRLGHAPGFENIDIFLGIRPKKTLQDFFMGTATLNEVLIKVNRHIHVIPSASGLTDLKNIDIYKRKMQKL